LVILFTLLLVVGCPAYLLIGLIKPNLVKSRSRGRVFVNTLALGAICFVGLGVSVPKQPTKVSETTTTKNNQKRESKIYNIGETISSDNWSIAVTDVQTTNQVGQYLPHRAKGTFYVVKLKITNLSKETDALAGSLYLKDSEERKYEGTGVGAIYAHEFGGETVNTQVPPGSSADGIAIYDVTNGATNLKLYWEPGLFQEARVISIEG